MRSGVSFAETGAVTSNNWKKDFFNSFFSEKAGGKSFIIIR